MNKSERYKTQPSDSNGVSSSSSTGTGIGTGIVHSIALRCWLTHCSFARYLPSSIHRYTTQLLRGSPTFSSYTSASLNLPPQSSWRMIGWPEPLLGDVVFAADERVIECTCFLVVLLSCLLLTVAGSRSADHQSPLRTPLLSKRMEESTM